MRRRNFFANICNFFIAKNRNIRQDNNIPSGINNHNLTNGAFTMQTTSKKTTAKTANTKATKKAGATPTKNEAPQRFIHNLNTAYNGASTSFGKKRSRTRIAIESFNTKPDAILTDRDNAFLATLKAQYGIEKPFLRGDADAGNLRRAIERGYIQHVDGDAASDRAKFQLTEKAKSESFGA